MDESPPVNYLKNIKTSKNRTVRIEVVGGVSEPEKHFLEGISYFTAGTLSKNDDKHTKYVADKLTEMITAIIKKITDGC